MPFRRRFGFGPRRRRSYGYGGQAPRMAAAPDPMKLVKSNLKAINVAYKTWLKDNAATHLVDAVGQFDSLVRLGMRMQKLAPDFQKRFEIAGKCRARAMGTTFDGERDTALVMALRQMEKITTFDEVPRIDVFLAKVKAKEEVQKAKAAAKAARAAAKAAGQKMPRMPRTPRAPRAPKVLVVGVNPYRKGSALYDAWDFMHADYHSKAELITLVTGKAQHPDFVVATLFKNRLNREPGAAWQMEADPQRPDYFKLITLPGVVPTQQVP